MPIECTANQHWCIHYEFNYGLYKRTVGARLNVRFDGRDLRMDVTLVDDTLTYE